MANKDNQSQRFIYIRSLKEKVPCTEQQFQEFYREATRIRKKEQYYHRCKCPKQFIWACDGDCENCEHHLGYGLLSLDAPNTEDGSTLLESEELAIELDEKYADVIVKRYIEQVGTSDGVSVIRDGLTYSYDEVAITEESDAD